MNYIIYGRDRIKQKRGGSNKKEVAGVLLGLSIVVLVKKKKFDCFRND